MRYGYSGKILRVDLTNRKAWAEALDEETYRLYPGGKALAAYILLRELGPGTDPLGSENILILANGLLTGAPFSTATRLLRGRTLAPYRRLWRIGGGRLLGSGVEAGRLGSDRADRPRT